MQNSDRTTKMYSRMIRALIGTVVRRPTALLPSSLAVLMTLGGLSAFAQQYYVAQSGDSLFSIALRNGTTVAALAAANGIEPPYIIHSGNRLIVTGPGDLAERNYIVRSGDNLFSIAQRNGITLEALAAANDIRAPYIIHAGNRLTVPPPWCPEDEVMAPATEPGETPGSKGDDPNLCYYEWIDCGDGSTPESSCRWKAGWCVANLGLDEKACRVRLCGEKPDPEDLPVDEPADEPEDEPKPKHEPKPEPTPEPQPRCSFIQRYDSDGIEIPWDTVDTFCMKACQADLPPIAECTRRGY